MPCRLSPFRKAALAPFHQVRHRRRPGRDRNRARVDAPRVEEIRDESAHLVRLLEDDAEELAHLGRVEPGRVLHQRHRRSLDRRERCAQLVAHQPQERRTQPLDLVERREILPRRSWR